MGGDRHPEPDDRATHRLPSLQIPARLVPPRELWQISDTPETARRSASRDGGGHNFQGEHPELPETRTENRLRGRGCGRFVLATVSGPALADKPFAGAALKWATFSGGTGIEELTEFVKAWEDETGATIEPVILPHPGFAEKVMLDAATGVNTYDLITLNYPKVGQFVEAGVVLALDDFLASDSARDIDAGDFNPAPARDLRFPAQGGRAAHGLPHRRLREARQAAGQDLGRVPRARKILQRQGLGWGRGGGVRRRLPVQRRRHRHRTVRRDAGRNGRALVDENFAPQLDTPESAGALEMIVALAGQGPPDTMAMGFSEYTNTFLLGEVPHLVVWGQVPVTAENPEKSKVVGNVGYAEVPGGAALLGGFGVSVLASTKQPEAAYDFAAWFTSKETERARIAGTRNIYDPGRTSTYNDAETVASRPWYPILGNNLANGVALPRIPEADELIQVLGQNVRRAAAGEIGIADALADAQARWEAILRKAGRLE